MQLQRKIKLEQFMKNSMAKFGMEKECERENE
jgi:hypothetical protein